MPPQKAARPEIALSSNAMVTLICVCCAAFMLCIAAFAGALMRSDAVMMVVARPKICVLPRQKPKILEQPHGSRIGDRP